MPEETHILKITDIQSLTHDVKQFKVEKPEKYSFIPGQATEVSIHKEDWKDEKRPFTFTNLPEDDHLEFVIKSYHDHDGVTKEIDQLNTGDEFIIGDAWGAISYKGPGTFIAGGAGITPFIAIFRQLHKENNLEGNRLIFSNKTSRDVILQEQWKKWLGSNFISTLTQEKSEGHLDQFIDKEFLQSQISDIGQQFYVCGPQQMVRDIRNILKEMGASPDGITFEK